MNRDREPCLRTLPPIWPTGNYWSPWQQLLELYNLVAKLYFYNSCKIVCVETLSTMSTMQNCLYSPIKYILPCYLYFSLCYKSEYSDATTFEYLWEPRCPYSRWQKLLEQIDALALFFSFQFNSDFVLWSLGPSANTRSHLSQDPTTSTLLPLTP